MSFELIDVPICPRVAAGDFFNVASFRLLFSKVSKSKVPSSRFRTMAVAEVARRAALHASAWQNTPEPFITSICVFAEVSAVAAVCGVSRKCSVTMGLSLKGSSPQGSVSSLESDAFLQKSRRNLDPPQESLQSFEQ